MQFFRDGRCYCHSCHEYGDATALTAQILGLSAVKAAQRIRADFHLDQPVDRRPDPSTKAKAKRRRDEKAARDKRWNYLCDVVREADERLAKYTPQTANAEFDVILAARCNADLELDLMWEDMRRERSR